MLPKGVSPDPAALSRRSVKVNRESRPPRDPGSLPRTDCSPTSVDGRRVRAVRPPVARRGLGLGQPVPPKCWPRPGRTWIYGPVDRQRGAPTAD